MLRKGTSVGWLIVLGFCLFSGVEAMSTEIESATLHLYAESAHGATVNVHAASADWNAAEVTWNSFNAGFDATPIASAIVSEAGWCTWDVTPQVQAWVNGAPEFGFVLDQKEISYPRTAFLSMENGDSAPYLEITYKAGDRSITKRFEAEADTYVWEFKSDYNAGTFPKLYTGWQSSRDLEKQILLRFNADIPTSATIGDWVWHDLNSNGIQDAGEPGIDNITVNLYDAEENLVGTTVTHDGGTYLFEVRPGDYFVEFVLPDNHAITPKGRAADDMMDSDMDPVSRRTECTHLELDEKDLSWDAGIYPCFACTGGVVELSLCYHGDYAVAVEVYQGTSPDEDHLLFLDAVKPGQIFTFKGMGPDSTMGGRISVYVDGRFATQFPTDCSKPIGPGLVRNGLEVIAGASRTGGKLSPMPECRECEGGITQLTLQYCGEESRAIEVYEGRKIDPDRLLFADIVDAENAFTFKGKRNDGTMGEEISLFVDGEFNSVMDTSCSKPIGVGLVAGSFTLVEGYSRDGGRLYDMPAPGEGECKGGVTSLSLRYKGEHPATIEVYQGYNVTADSLLFKETVNPNDTFSFSGKVKRGTLGSDINLFIDALHNATIRTDCSEPIGPGLVRGRFEVTEGYSLQGGKLMPVPGINPCEGGITMLMLRYTGEQTAFISIFSRPDADPDSLIFVTSADPDSTFAFTGKGESYTMGEEIYLFKSGELNATIHTSGVKPIGAGLVAGDFEVIEGYSRVGGKLPPMK
ncbi:MAG: SdrD B-like domain-containing protein [Planctomycetota bacterium]